MGFGKSYAENVMGMSPDVIQTMMHHRSINSQKKYGWVANERMHAALNEAFDKILPPSQKALPKS
jgi:site-specific recombinase XerD